MEGISIFIIVFLVSLIVLTAFKLYREIKFIREEKEKSKEIFEMFSDRDKKM